MLARQQADSSKGGFAVSSLFFYSFHFFIFFFFFFLFFHMGSQGWLGHCYGFGFSGWDLVQG